MGLEAEEKEKEGVRVVQPHLTRQVTPTTTFLKLRGILINLTLFTRYFVCLKQLGILLNDQYMFTLLWRCCYEVGISASHVTPEPHLKRANLKRKVHHYRIFSGG